jgi:hypothetical protein
MELFYNRRIVVATPDTLREAVLESGSRRRRASPQKQVTLPT